MPVTVHQCPCLSDNYGFLVRDAATGQTACIDTPDAAAILATSDEALSERLQAWRAAQTESVATDPE